MGTTKENQSGNSMSENLNKQRFILAVIIFIAYIIFIIYLITKTSTENDLLWTRLLYLFTGIEAIVFAALGYVFGRDINRSRAENAEKDAEKAKKDEAKAKADAEKAKKESQKEREKGIALSTAVKSASTNTRIMFENFSSKRIKNDVKDKNEFLTELAYKLYPTPYDYVTISFDYEITPSDNIKDITIDTRTKFPDGGKGSYSDVPIFDNRFSIDVNRKDSLKNWTFKITRIVDSNGKTRKQLEGKLDSKYDTDYVRLENL